MAAWTTIATITILLYLLAELTFLVYFLLFEVPIANRKTTPHEYRDYGKRRHKLLVRILSRMERTCRATGRDFDRTFQAFLSPWFHVHNKGGEEQEQEQEQEQEMEEIEEVEENGGLKRDEATDKVRKSASKSSSSSSSCSSTSSSSFTPRKEDAAELLSWAFFCKHAHELEPWEQLELQSMFHILRTKYSIEFRPGRTFGVTPKRLNLDTLQPLPRPLLVYAVIALLQFVSAVVLRWFGFRYYRLESGLTYWYRPAPAAATTDQHKQSGANTKTKNDNNQPPPPPMLFFHGIAPAGLTFYVPMVLRCLCRIYDSTGHTHPQQPIFLFENRPISYNLCRHAVNEEETVRSVLTAVDHHLGPNTNTKLALCGHSFGSCQVTWLLRAAPHRISQIILLDPVTILLSEPDVMNNFLYKNRHEALSTFSSAKIYLLASTELYTEHYLRRHFSWYNSELWLEDIPEEVKVLICLSGRDEIVNVDKVLREVMVYRELQKRQQQQQKEGEEVVLEGERRRRLSSSSFSSSSSSSSSCAAAPEPEAEQTNASESLSELLASESKSLLHSSSCTSRSEDEQMNPSEKGDSRGTNIQVIHWPTDGHAACVTSSKHWAELRRAIRAS